MVVARGRARPPRTTTTPPSGGAAVAVGEADGVVEQQQAAPSGVSHGGGDYPQRTAGAQPRLGGCSCRPCRGDIHAAGAAYAWGPYLPSRGIGLA